MKTEKTTEQIKKEVVIYLEKTSNHLFIKENGDFYKVILSGDNFIIINGDKVSTYNIDEYIKWNGVNTKCMVKHLLFLNKKLKSIKNFKTMKEKSSKIKEAISGKTDKSEITKIVTSLIKDEVIVVSEEKKSFLSKLFGK